MKTKVLWTNKFAEDFRRYTGARQRVVRTVRTAIRRMEAVQDWYDGKKAMQGINELLYELRATHSDRVLVRAAEGRLYLVDVGQHEITDEYASRPPAARQADFATAVAAPDYFHPSVDAPLFVDVDEPPDFQWEEEFGKDWLHFLGDQQKAIRDLVVRQINTSIGKPTVSPYVGQVTGGAGTGKTALMLALAMDYDENGWVVDFRCSGAMRSYLTDYAGIEMSKLQVKPGQTPDLVFLDDPESVDAVTDAVKIAKEQKIGGIVAGYDPLQWWNDKILAKNMPKLGALGPVITLRECYRQSGELVALVQGMSRKVNDRSAWRIDPSLIAQERTFMGGLLDVYSDGLTPLKRGGRVKPPRKPTTALIAAEAEWLRANLAGYDGMPDLLIVLDKDRGADLQHAWRQELQIRGLRVIERKLSDVRAYKGLDFPAVWLFLGKDLLERLEVGKPGLNKPQWGELRSLHVALTRAKESVAIFHV